MAQAVYRKSGTIFRAYIDITANPNDTVTVIGPEDYRETFNIGSSGTVTAIAKTKGVYTVSGAVSLQTVTIDVQVARARYSANVSFSGILKITGNGGDTVSISGPGSYSKSVTLNSSGTTDIIVVTEPGNYTATGNISNVQASGAASKGNTLTLNVAFSCLVKVTANPGASITLTSTTGSNIPTYSAKANASTGIAQVTVRRKTTFTVSTDTKTDGSVLSTSPASVSSVNVNDTTTKNITHIRVYSTPNLSAGVWSSKKGYVYYADSSISDDRFSGIYIRYKANSAPSSLTDGTAFADGKGQSLAISNTVTKIGFTTGELIANTQYYYLGAVYLTVGSTKYYANTKTANWKCIAVASAAQGNSLASGTWEVPAGVRRITVFCCGGGGAGGCGGAYSYSNSSGTLYDYVYGGGGGGGGYCASNSLDVIPGQKATVTVGPGGSTSGARGENTRFLLGSFDLNGNGGYGGGNCTSSQAYGYNSDTSKSYGYGGNGGSGGGAGGYYLKPGGNGPQVIGGGNGGSTGSGGASATGYDTYPRNTKITGGPSPGSGIGASGVKFESTVYSGGGGGGGRGLSSPAVTGYGSGGTRGGGNGAHYTSSSSSANANSGTDGSGGGGGGGYSSYAWARGGSGAVIVKY